MNLIMSARATNTDGIIRNCLKQTVNSNCSVFITSATPDNPKSNHAFFMFDNNANTYFYSNEKINNFIQFKFEGALVLTSMMLWGIHNPTPNAFNLLGSKNGKTWEMILSMPNLNGKLYNYGQQIYQISDNSNLYKIIKLHITNNEKNAGGNAGLIEMELFGDLYEIGECIINTAKSCFSISSNHIYVLLFIDI